MSWISAARTRLQLIFARKATESRADIEIGFHIDMETHRLMREKQLSQDEARRQAIVSFGGVSQHKETLREGHGLAWLGGFSLDMKLGARMLRKYPGLTFIGGLAMAFAIWTGAVIFQIVSLIEYPTLPLPDGDRIVKVANWDIEAAAIDSRATHDFLRWRGALTSINELGVYRDLTRNLITSDGDSRAVAGAEVTAAAFRIAPTPPLMGRVIRPSDEQAGAPPVVLLGYDVWRARFAGDPAVVGRTVKLGDASATVVGVMPKGFAFPVAHELWTQFRPDAVPVEPRGGPGITVFGKLAPDVSIEAARVELTTIGQRSAAEFPATHARLQPRVAPYAKGFSGMSSNGLAMAASMYFLVMLLLVLVCSNVALLIFARAATREGELIVRSALGADRKRIVMQLFAEALVLGGVAAAVGLIVADVALRTWGVSFLRENIGTLPFWYHVALSPMTVAWSLGLTVLAAAIAGMLPALKITRGLGARLRQGSAGGGGVKFGGVWTAVIIAQVAVTVAFPSVIAVETRELRRVKSFDIGFAAGEYLGVRVELDGQGGDSAQMAAQRAQYGLALEDLRRRLAAEPGVRGVTFAERLPRLNHRETYAQVVGGGVDTTTAEVSFMEIDPSYFAVLQSPVLAGRAFVGADAAFQARAVIVDQVFVDQLLKGRNAVGRQMRLVERPRSDGKPSKTEPWVEIVGVVKELGMTDMYENDRMGGVYFPADLATSGTMFMVVHAPGDPMAHGPRIRELTAAVDPMLRLSDMQRLDQVADPMLWILNMWIRLSVLLAAIAVLLSLAGIYAVLSFTVSRRTREIGVRVALGASRKGLVIGIFKRPLINVTLGVVAGAMIIALLSVLANEGDGGLARVEYSLANIASLVVYAGLMFGVCLLACIVPTLRALRVEPTEALRAE